MTDRLLDYEATAISQLKIRGLGAKSAEKLALAGIVCARDLIWFLPREYLDLSRVVPVSEAEVGQTILVCGRVIHSASHRTQRRRIPVFEMLLDDGSGTIRAVYFNQPYLSRTFVKGSEVALYGKIEFDRRGRYLANPKVTPAAGGPRIQPVYRQVAGLKSERIAAWIDETIKRMPDDQIVPDELTTKFGYRRKEAFLRVHNPLDSQAVALIRNRQSPALQRLIAEELFFFSLGMTHLASSPQRVEPIAVEATNYDEFVRQLPFEPTNDQRSAMLAVQSAFGRGERVFSLIQGDVGCGKTLIALYAAFLMARAGQQSAILCPTSLLSSQHANTAQELLTPFGLNVALFSSRQSNEEQNRVLHGLAEGDIDLVIGTHRVFQDDVRYAHLGLAVIDEQHRFGVNQRAKFIQKGKRPHYLALSATPIPRSLALTLYAGYSVHQIKEKPIGRKPVKTILKKACNRSEVIAFAQSRVKQSEAVFWVFPYIEGEEADREKSALAMVKELRQHFGEQRVGLVHGRLERDEMARVMADFRRGAIDVMVATTVIEVGVDVARASVMVIDGADRFGLSQLHQLRGRVGRGKRRGFAFLVVDEPVSKETLRRLRVMEQTDDGFEIAQADLDQRGFGALLGKLQSGFVTFRAADLWFDRELFDWVRQLKPEPEPLYDRWLATFPFAEKS